MRALAVLVLAALVAGCASNDGPEPGPQDSAAVSSTTPPARNAPGNDANVILKDDFFIPAGASGAVGGATVWVNQGESAHTITADNGAFDSGAVASGGRFSFTPTMPGSYPYHCKFHAGMRGTLNVTGSPASPPPATTTPTTTTPPPAGEASVVIADLAFGPATVEVPAGGVVTWTNDDGSAHTVEADDGSFRSGVLAKDARFAHTFAETGSFPYKCGLHPAMRGTVVVT